MVPQLKSLKEAIHVLEDVTFLDYKGYADEAYETSKVVNSVARLHSLNSARQTTINEYFNPLHPNAHAQIEHVATR